ncbi:hypothetical protein M2432_003143 [Mycobacterium sp. OTB74]|nr:hypothetical protein [Mycobacterium sp. OTB74]
MGAIACIAEFRTEKEQLSGVSTRRQLWVGGFTLTRMQWAITILLWLFCAACAAVIGNLKGRNIGESLLWGLLLGAIGVVVVACRPSKAAEPNKNAPLFSALIALAAVAATVFAVVEWSPFGTSVDTDDLGSWVKQSMQQKFDSDDKLAKLHLHVQDVNLIHKSGNEYTGMAKVQTGKGASHDVPIDVIADGDNRLWKAEPGAFAFLISDQLDSLKNDDEPATTSVTATAAPTTSALDAARSRVLSPSVWQVNFRALNPDCTGPLGCVTTIEPVTKYLGDQSDLWSVSTLKFTIVYSITGTNDGQMTESFTCRGADSCESDEPQVMIRTSSTDLSNARTQTTAVYASRY